MYNFRLQGRTAQPPPRPPSGARRSTWRQGDQIPLTAEPTLRVLGIRDDDADQPPALIIEDVEVGAA
jgi:hypothetical protein